MRSRSHDDLRFRPSGSALLVVQSRVPSRWGAAELGQSKPPPHLPMLFNGVLGSGANHLAAEILD